MKLNTTKTAAQSPPNKVKNLWELDWCSHRIIIGTDIENIKLEPVPVYSYSIYKI